MMMKLTEYDEDIPSFYVEVDYIIVVRHHVMSQQLFSSNCRQLGIATDPSVANSIMFQSFSHATLSHQRFNASDAPNVRKPEKFDSSSDGFL
jgi:hypothetical protein